MAATNTKSEQNNSSKLPSGIFKKILLVFFVGILAWGFQAIQPPGPKKCGSPGGPPVTAPRIQLSDGRYLAYKEHGVRKEDAKFKVVYVHGFGSSKDDRIVPSTLTREVLNELGVYIVSFDRPGYGESDPNPNRNVKSMALDIEELANRLGFGSRFYVIGFSIGGQVIWSCLKYIPHRLAGAALLAPATNYFWSGFPTNLSKEIYSQLLPQDQWALRVARYAPWLTYWWNTQRLFPRFSVLANSLDILSSQDMELLFKNPPAPNYRAKITQQGDYESLHRDLMVTFGKWEFDPMDVENPFPNNEGSVHLWQGDEDRLVPVNLQRYIVEKLPWIRYHEVHGAGHLFPSAEGMSDSILKTFLSGDK